MYHALRLSLPYLALADTELASLEWNLFLRTAFFRHKTSQLEKKKASRPDSHSTLRLGTSSKGVSGVDDFFLLTTCRILRGSCCFTR
jgi:hypothetical protein